MLLTISVKGNPETKLFFLENASREVYFESLCAAHFEGYQRTDRLRLLRAGAEISTGSVVYMGHHDAGEYFCHLNGVKRQFTLLPKDFEVGDILEIDTENYDSVDTFSKILVMTDSLDTALRDAFANNNDSLNSLQLNEATMVGVRSAEKTLNEQGTLLLHHV